VSSGASLNAKTKDGKNSLFVACEESHADIVKYLIKSGADVNLCSNSQQSALHIALENCSNSQIATFLIKANAQLSAMDGSGRKPVYFAAIYGHDQIWNDLIKKKEDILTSSKPLLNSRPSSIKVLHC
jgi:ankyrin repeat protein